MKLVKVILGILPFVLAAAAQAQAVDEREFPDDGSLRSDCDSAPERPGSGCRRAGQHGFLCFG